MENELSPVIMGMVVIALLQLSQFFFAWKKDMRANDSVRKADLTDMRNDLMAEIDDVATDLKDYRAAQDAKMEAVRIESARARDEIHERITEIAVKQSALVAGQDTISQTLLAMSNKVDRMLMKTTNG